MGSQPTLVGDIPQSFIVFSKRDESVAGLYQFIVIFSGL
jgi:hypothetical protein